jgi:hypothetical protein
MTAISPTARRRISLRGALVATIAAASILAIAGSAIVLGTGKSSVAGVRAATAAFHDLAAAEAAGYEPFYVCTDENGGAGAMGQHYVNGSLVGTTEVDPLTPEALVYEPNPNGGDRLVGVEYVTFQEAWDAANAAPPSLFGRNFALVPAGNRYGLPAFYQLHVWLWRPNPSGLFNDWNPKVSCRGQGDPA